MDEIGRKAEGVGFDINDEEVSVNMSVNSSNEFGGRKDRYAIAAKPYFEPDSWKGYPKALRN